jgi:predicted ATP-grasp superfamily ATP-dependent carboligase/L-amino acid N-acyltransferase YncA
MSQVLHLMKESFQNDGVAAVARLLRKELRCRYRFWLLKRELGPTDLPEEGNGSVRVADPSSVNRIIAAWPEEFRGTEDSASMRRRIVRRFEDGHPCLISERDGRVEGAVWCVPWEFDDQMRPTKGQADAFEICNLFVARECRGRGIGRQLLLRSLSLMAARGKRVAYSRVLPERHASIALHLSVGFHLMGVMYSCTTLGRQRSRVVPLTKASRADVRGLAMPPCVLLAQGAWGSTLEAIRSLGSRGVAVYVFVLGRDPMPYAKSRYCRDARRLDCQDAASLSRELIDWCEAQRFSQKPLLLPFTDISTTFVAEARPILESHFTIGSPSPESVRGVMDKEQAHSLAIACGLDVPQTAVVRTHAELQAAAGMAKYPAIVKPTWWRERGSGGLKTMIFTTPHSLVAGLTPMLDGHASALVQEYVPGTDRDIETFVFYRGPRGTLWGCTSRKLRQSPLNAGIMATGHAVEIPDLRRLCAMFLERIDYHGLGGIEFKRSGDRLVYIETNARLGAFHALARKAGLDLVWIAYCDYSLGGLGEEPCSQHEAYYINWAALWATYGSRRVIPWAADVLRMLIKRPLKIAVFEWTDPCPSAYLIRNGLRERLGRLLTRLRLISAREPSDVIIGSSSELLQKRDI